MRTAVKKLFKHGGSYAVDIPMDFVRHTGTKEVIIESAQDKISIRAQNNLDTIEADPLFHSFVEALIKDALKHPDKLRNVKEVWDKEWDKLLEGIEVDGE